MANARKTLNKETKNCEQFTDEGIRIISGWQRYANREEAKAISKLKKDSSSKTDYYRKRAEFASEIARKQRKEERKKEGDSFGD